MAEKQLTPVEVAYAAWLRVAKEKLGTSAAVVRAMQDRLTPADLSTVHSGWASKYGKGDWRSSRYAQWEKGRTSVPTQPAIRAALIATITETVTQPPVEGKGFGTFAQLVDALEDEKRRKIATAATDDAAQEKKSQTRNYLVVEAGAARELNGLELGLGSWAYDNQLPPYVSRSSDTLLIGQANDCLAGLTVVVGPPKSGKSRSVHHLLQQHHPDAQVWWANPGPGVLMGLTERIRATPADKKPEIIVLDDAQLCGVNPGDGLTTARLTALAGKTHLIVIIHDKDLAEWTRQTTDRATDTNISLTTIGATPELVTLLTNNSIIYEPTLDATELTVAAEVYDKAHASLDQLDLTRMAEAFASVTQLTEKANAALTTGGLHAAIVNAAIDATIAFPAGITLDLLDRLTQAHYQLEEPNKPWKSNHLDTALDWATTGIAPRSPHAILTRTAATAPDADTYRLLDVLTPTLRSAERDLTYLTHITLPVTAISDIAYWYYENQNRTASRQWWMVAAKQDQPDALFNLGVLAGEDGDRDEARTWYLKAATFNHPGALFNLGVWAEEDSDRDEARTWLLKAAALNDPDALANLAVLAGKDGDRDEARTWLLKAAALNDPGALSTLGVLAGQDGDRDEARTWFLKAAALDHPGALFSLGVLAGENGDRDEARTWFLKAAALDHPDALFSFGVLAGEDGDRDEARTWFLKAAALNHPDALSTLGVLAKEDGDRDEARTWFLKAAALNSSRSMLNLGAMAIGDGDLDEARTWFLKAAALNHPDALFGLGVLADHDGDRNAARIWWERAVDAGSNEAQESLDQLQDENDGQPEA